MLVLTAATVGDFIFWLRLSLRLSRACTKRLNETQWPETRDETETRRYYVSRPSRDRDVSTDTTSL